MKPVLSPCRMPSVKPVLYYHILVFCVMNLKIIDEELK